MLKDLPAPPAGRTGWPWTVEGAALPPARPDGRPWPRVTVVTPAYDQGRFLEETIRSVLLQGYPALEYVVIDDGSTDDTAEVIARYAPWLAHHETQPNAGQAAAINRGFEHATGDVLAFLNADDTYLPGALERAASAIDPTRGRHVVMGRCQFTDAENRPIGVEHPSAFESHRRVLAVWKGHTIPQPSVFWTPEVWRRCGPMIEDLGRRWIDYGLFCRVSRHYRFHPVDQVLSTYRLHDASQTQTTTADAALAEYVQISRRYWGPRWSPKHLWLAVSWARHRADPRARARAALLRSREARERGERLRAAASWAHAAMLHPGLVFLADLFPALRRRLPARVERWIERAAVDAVSFALYVERTEPWTDGWVGPRVAFEREAVGGERTVCVSGYVHGEYLKAPLELEVAVGGRTVGRSRAAGTGAFTVSLPLPEPLPPGAHRIEVHAHPFFVPHLELGNGDHRPLCWMYAGVALEAG